MKKYEIIEVPFLRMKAIPAPSQVVTTWDWYFLDQISSPLVKWNSESGSFEGLLAKSWQIKDSILEFELKPNILFSNGSEITTTDVAHTVKRAILKRTNSHFKPWELLKGCDNLTSIDQECPGIEVLTSQRIRFILNHPSESFFLYLACPEGAIWQSSDLNDLEKFSPTAFSGAYVVSEFHDNQIILTANQHWPLNKIFEHRPKKILAMTGDDSMLMQSFVDEKISVMLDLIRPFQKLPLNTSVYSEKLTGFNTLYYLFRVNGARGFLPKAFLSNLWEKNFPSDLRPADAFLPFPGLSGIAKEQIIHALPVKNDLKIRVGYLKGYFADEFINFLFSHDPQITAVPLISSEYNSTFSLDYSKSNLDFVLTPYVASERYPSGQISFLLEGRKPPFEIEKLDYMQETPQKKKLLGEIQKWLVQNQQVLPLVFGRSRMVFKSDLNVGRQPLVDSEIQLWRINE